MEREERDERGCPLRNQTGPVGVKHFAAVIERLSPELRAAFETERAARQAELDAYVAQYGYAT